MAERLIKEGILVVRKGVRITPEIGKSFDLTAEEIKDLERVRPQAIARLDGVQADPRSKPTPANADDSGGQGNDGDDTNDETDLDGLERDELVSLAAERGVKHAKNASREKIIAALSAAAGDDDGL